MKIGIKNNEAINLLVVFAVVLIPIEIFYICAGKFAEFVVMSCILAGESVPALIVAIKNALNYIVVDDESITLYRGKKIVKQIDIADIKSLVLGQYVINWKEFNPNKHTNQNFFIVINDGTFVNKSWTKREFRKNILRNSEGWIAIEYSAKRYAALKKLLPNCEVETYTLTKK